MIVHLGLGVFFGAHGAIHAAVAMAKSGGDRAITGVSLRSPATRDRLRPRGWAYAAVALGPDGATARVIRDVLVAPEDPRAVLDLMAAERTRIVSLTVTEKGYCHQPATERLDRAHPDILHDIAAPLPRPAPGFLVRALEARRAAGLHPFTVLCCDNQPGNGRLARAMRPWPIRSSPASSGASGPTRSSPR